MNTPKKPGRPPGTDYHEDNAAMELMAEAIVAGHAKNPTEAARSIYKSVKCRGPSERAIIARLVVKWGTKGEMALIRAKGRVEKTTPSVQLPRDVSAAKTLEAWASYGPFGLKNRNAAVAAASAPGMAEWARSMLGGGGQSRTVHILATQDAARDAAKSLEAMGGASELHRRAEEVRATIEAAGGLTKLKRRIEQARATMRDLGLTDRRRSD